MLTYHLIQDIADTLSEYMPAEIKEAKEAVVKNAKAILESKLSESTVTRTEFDALQRMLSKNRAQLMLLEQKVIALEQRLQAAMKTDLKN